MTNHKTRWDRENPPNLLLATDPGAAWPGKQRDKQPYAGCALFQWGVLCWVGLVRAPVQYLNERTPPHAMPNLLVRKICEEAGVARHAGDHGEMVTVVAAERPEIWTGSPSRPRDIVALRGIWGAIIGGIDAEFYAAPTASESKGTIKDDLYNQNTWDILNGQERLIVLQARQDGRCGPPAQHHHVDNGYGLGLFVLGRCTKGGLPP